MALKEIGNNLKSSLKARFNRTIMNPINELVDQNLMDISTTIGSFIIRSVRGKFQRSITFTVGRNYGDQWMEEALYGILYTYNNIKKSSRLELRNPKGSAFSDGSGLHYQLDDGTHNLKYRNFDILLAIQTISPSTVTGRVTNHRVYTIITYDLSPEFVIEFERDMVAHRNSLLKIKADAPTINVYQDYHEGDGWTYWEKMQTINKRRLATIYLEPEIKKKIVDTVNEFFANKEYYKRHGIAHNLKILLYGPPGPQPVDTWIPTTEGFKQMKDMKPGDYVYSVDGVPTKIEEIYNYYQLPLYTVTMEDGRTINCADTHKFPVIIPDDSKYYRRTNVRLELTVKELMDEFDIHPDSEYRIPLGTAQGARLPYQAVPVEPWTFGFLLGSSVSLQHCDVTISEHPYYFQTDSTMALEIIAETIGKKVSNLYQDKPGLWEIDYNQSRYFIPLEYLWNTVEVRAKLLAGFLDGIFTDNIEFYNYSNFRSMYKRKDMKINPGEITFQIECQSGSYADLELIWIARSLGMFASLIKGNFHDGFYELNHMINDQSLYQQIQEKMKTMFDPNTPLNQERYIMEFKIQLDSDVLKYSIKYQDLYQSFFDDPDIGEREYDLFHSLRISSIKKGNISKDMRCLHVEDSEHLYLETNFTPTCNTGKDSIAKMIASEWNRNIYYITGGKDGKFIPNAITSTNDSMNYPLLLISDIDKYPYLINEPTIDPNADGEKTNAVAYKQLFGNMINALDGILSGEDRIVIMTTNHIEKFSDTFLRPGRIDLKQEIGYITPVVFRKYVYDFYGVELPKDIQLNDDKLTIAKLQFDVVYLKLTADEFIEKHLKKSNDKKPKKVEVSKSENPKKSS